MFEIRCPYCGPRDEPEFKYGGQAHVAYPADPELLSDEEWARFLFVRDNSRGRYAERWNHAAGCRRWFNVIRDTGTHELVGSYRVGEQPGGRPMKRLDDRGRIDHDHSFEFTYDGRSLTAHPGDTLASALLANGVDVIGTSVLMSRPRGVVTDNVTDPHAFAQVGTGDVTEPLVRMNQIEVHPGFEATGRLHQGVLPTEREHTRFEKRFAHCDVLVVGAGPAGLSAALAAADAGARVILVDDHPHLGGALLGGEKLIDNQPAMRWVADVEARLRANPDVTILTRTTAFNNGDQGAVALMERVTEHLPESRRGGRALRRMWQVRTHELVVATGATERPLVFADNDRPGVMLAAGVRGFLHRFGLVPEKLVVFTADDDAYRTAIDLAGAGVDVQLIVDVRTDPQGSLITRARELGIEIRDNAAVIGTDGDACGVLTAVRVTSLDGGVPEAIACDCLAVSGGWDPLFDLHLHVAGGSRWDRRLVGFVPDGTLPGIRVTGAATGIFGTAGCRRDGHVVGLVAAEATGHGTTADGPPAPEGHDANEGPTADFVDVPGTERIHAFVDQHRDVALAGVDRALGSGIHHVEHLKRYTLVGTGTEQGRTAKVNAGRLTARHFGLDFAEVGISNARPLAQPMTFGSLAGRSLGVRFDPVRTTSIHPWHVAHGAIFEDVGQWKRPWFFPQGDEDMDAAVLRECAAVREGVGMMDASTLGKIDVKGKDAGEFLDRLYTGVMSSLKPGRARYGVMCKADGMVMDDGVVLRLADDHFMATTTTGGAAGVLDWMEDFLQTEWPDLDVWLTSVTEQWATVAVVGPKAREVMAVLAPELDVTQDAFKFMQLENAVVAGIESRVARISFSGELAFEINVPMTYGLALWEAVYAAGQPFGITPYGTESMHVLRAEKGYFIVGQETDGTVTPLDLGLDWMIADKEFVGRRSLRRSDMLRDDRKQLVGILPVDPKDRLPEGAQLIDSAEYEIPVPMIGHVTSSYESSALGRTFGLALVRGGRNRIGDTIYAPLGDRTVPVEIVDAVIFDQEGRAAMADRAEPLAALQSRIDDAGFAGTTLATVPFMAQVGLRVEPGSASAGRVEAALGLELPEANRVSESGGRRAIWLGPDEWLVIAADGEERSLVALLEEATSGEGSVVDLSANRTGLELAGPEARTVLATCCSLDFHPRAFGSGQCAQTLIHKAGVLVEQRGDDRYLLLVRPSFAAYVAEWLLDGMLGLKADAAA